MPKPPPMSPLTTRKSCGLGAEHRAQQVARAGRLLVLRVERGAPASCTPIAQRGSIAIAFRRWLCSSTRETCAAAANALSTAAASP